LRRAHQLGRYHLLDRIAFGGMAEIYRAKTFDAAGHAHLVAVKRVLAHLAEDDDFIQMLVDEAKIAGLLRHTNIARVYEFARAHGEYFIAMEHVDGKDLRTILERCRQKRQPIPPDHAAWIASEVASALHAAHTALDRQDHPLHIVHRDVSPSNIICAYTGEVKLCDFGIAKATLSKVNTKTGVIKGKVKYMSPEQALGRKLDHRSDLFSLGTCLYEMLTRVPPFTATNEMDLLIKVRDARYRAISELVPGVPPELEAVCDKCLARSRANRYQTALEAGDALRDFLRKYMPNYSRSHLGRYIRKMFAQEIERELRMLEEYVVVDVVDEDLGENLIAGALGPRAAYSEFTPRAPAGQSHSAARLEEDSDFLPHSPQHLSNATTIPRIDDPSEDGAANAGAGGFDIHAAETLILDRSRPSGRPERGPRALPKTGKLDDERRGASPAPEPKRKPPRFDRDNLDEALHNAPTLILDSSRRGKR
jgi:serine/threonine-protein kinase